MRNELGVTHILTASIRGSRDNLRVNARLIDSATGTEIWEDAGVEFAQPALRLDPLNYRAPYLNILGTNYLHAGRYREAIDAFERNQRWGGPNAASIRILAGAAPFHRGDGRFQYCSRRRSGLDPTHPAPR